MKYILILIAVLLLGCESAPTIESAFPFSKAAKIEILSYSEERFGEDLSINGGKINIDNTSVKERVEIDDEARKKLFDFLFIEECPFFSSAAKCYIPRHLIVFYDEDDNVFAYLEVCLECGRAEGNFRFNDFCDERMDSLALIFKEAGITHFGEL